MKKERITISERAVARIAVLLSYEQTDFMFRIRISGGGCSGFQYMFSLDNNTAEDDILISHGDAKVVIDPVSLVYMEGSEIDFVDELIGQSFKIRNPNAKSSCGCGASFSVQLHEEKNLAQTENKQN
ncbi:MAG: iron-sulfur cluster insertion protein ErpA [Alphaproteobacteria bacterium]|nr:iron-sulfur cluster insertion protein ErpA [Alphaproteobacteria bacterium]